MHSHPLRYVINVCLCVGVLATAALVCAWLVRNPVQPARQPQATRIPRVQVVAVNPQTFESPIVGYGTIRPKRQIKIVPQVSGRLVQVHKDLAPGNFIAKGELLFEIDSRIYDAKVRQAEADIARLKAMLNRHEHEKIALENRLQVAQDLVQLAERGVERENNLEHASTDAERELAKERHLRQRDLVLGYQSQLNLIPVLINETKALLAVSQAQLDEAKLFLDNTKIICPCDVRVDSVSAQESQVVNAYFHVATLTDMEALELSVVVDPRELRWSRPEVFASAIGDELPDPPEARVTWTMMGQEFSWTGQVTRLERLDQMTRTAHMVVEIREVMRGLRMGQGQNRLPLSVGMFCKAELPTEPLDNALVIPRHAVQEGRYVYVFQPETDRPDHGQLAIKKVPMLRNIGEQVLVSFGQGEPVVDVLQGGIADTMVCELQSGDLVIVSPLPKAVEGMRLQRNTDIESVAVSHTPQPIRLADARSKAVYFSGRASSGAP
ncbi:MAG: biotin/lipoyl-binding protein [Phycisphaerales bacterium]|nr:biotin/lipoyl-binding protein [Phycisphaerales bacterium]